MSVLVENIEEQALALSAEDRRELASRLVRSITDLPSDEDEGIADALRRREELRKDPSIGISLEEIDRRMKERYG